MGKCTEEELNAMFYCFYLNSLDSDCPNYGEEDSPHTHIEIKGDDLRLLICVPPKEFLELEDRGWVKHKLHIQKCYGTWEENIQKITPIKEDDDSIISFSTIWDTFGEWDWETYYWIQDLSFEDSISDWYKKNSQNVKREIKKERESDLKEYEETWILENAVIICSEWRITDAGIKEWENRMGAVISEKPLVIKPKQKRQKMDLERRIWITRVVEWDITSQKKKPGSNRKYLSNKRLAEIFGFDEQLFRKNKKLRDEVDSVRKSLLGDLSKYACNDED